MQLTACIHCDEPARVREAAVQATRTEPRQVLGLQAYCATWQTSWLLPEGTETWEAA